MKLLKRTARASHSWLRHTALVDLLGLGLGLLLSVLYYKRYSDGFGDPLGNLWPNIATEILGVWLSVRIIDALIRRREKRSRVRSGLVGNLNYLVGLSREIGPYFDSESVRRLDHEVHWLNELEAYRRKRLSKGEKEKVAVATGLIERVEQAARRIGTARDELNRAAELPDAEHYARLDELRKQFDHRLRRHPGEEDRVGRTIQAVREDIEHGTVPRALVPILSALLKSTSLALADLRTFRNLVEGFVEAVYLARADILEEELR